MRTVLLIIISVSSLMGDFTRNINEVVRDSKSDLEWQDNNESNSTNLNWIEAITHCENLTLDAKSDWKLPNLNELNLLLDDGKANPSIDSVFQYINSNDYWSSTTYINGSDYGWYVSFSDGNKNAYPKYDQYYVRCVRGGE